MLSKKSPPPRPKLPQNLLKTRKPVPSGGTKQVAENQDTGLIRKLDFFSIRYSRDDANESDEEISIVRKEDNVEEDEGESEKASSSVENNLALSESLTNTNSVAISLLSTISRPFLNKLPTKTSSEASSFEDKAALEIDVDSASEKETEEREGSASRSSSGEGTSSNGRRCVSPLPLESRKEGSYHSVVSSAMSLSSLLKKEVEQRIHLGKDDATQEALNQGLEIDPRKKNFLSSALFKSSQLVVPFGMSSVAPSPKKDIKMERSYTDVPVYNIIIVSVGAFLFLMFPTSSFANGLVFGAFLTFFLVCGLMWLLTPEMSDEERYKRDVIEHAKEMESLEQKQQKSFQPWELSKLPDLEGWFFKASSYNPTEPVDFSDPEQVTPVYANLSGSLLTLQIPRKEELPKIKRSCMLEPNDKIKIKFSISKHYDLGDSGNIELVPDTLLLKRIWAKKYPVYLKVFEKPIHAESDTEDKQEIFELPSVTEEMYLFSPTGRGKEEWYYRMEKILKPQISHMFTDVDDIFGSHASFPHYMAQLIGAKSEASSEAQLTWVNALLGRLFWDVWKSEYWNNKVKSRIQNKISKMKLPPFIRYLKVTDMRLGHALPTIQRAHNLLQNDRGIWVDLEVDYEGGIMLTIETMINLEYYLKQLTDQGKSDAEEVILKFNRDESCYSDSSDEGDWNDESLHVPTTNSQFSPESLSSDGSEGAYGDNPNSDTEVDGENQLEPTSEQEKQGWAEKVKNPKGKKILNMLEKVAKSKWVQKAAETKVVQRAVEKFSNLPIILAVEVAKLRGTLAANIPPPPSNRLWFGFHSNTLLSLIARPKLGERHVRLTHVTDWIEYKLKQEFKSMFVLPNMEDLTIRIMDSGLEDKFPTS